jgi:hypothetical protein
MSLKLSHKEVVSMFVKLGRKQAGDWDESKMKKRIKNIKSDMEDVEIPKELSTADSILTKILDAQDKGEKIVVLADGEIPATTKSGAVDKRDKDKKSKDKKDGKKKKSTRVNWITSCTAAFVDMKGKSFKFSELANAAGDLHVKSGGNPNEEGQNINSRRVLDVMEELGIVTVDGDTITRTGAKVVSLEKQKEKDKVKDKDKESKDKESKDKESKDDSKKD